MIKNTLLIALFIGMLSPFGFAQSFDKAKLDEYFNLLEENDKFMGTVAVSKDGAIIYSKSIGFCELDHEQVANKNSKYRIGSISKTFTSVLVLKAVEENKLTLNQSIDQYFPSIENAKKINIQNLLYHRSGIHNFTKDKEYLTWNTQPKTEEEMIAIIAAAGSDFVPDSKTEYSNSNFVLLSYILEKTYDKSFADLLDEQIIQPTGLTDTYFGSMGDKNECQSYKNLGQWKIEAETAPSIPMGAGGIVSTAKDMTKFSDALFNGKLLSSKSLEQMKNIKDGFGIGLFKIPFHDKIGYGHTGGIDGFRSVFSYFPDGKVSYVLLSNGTKMNNNDISIAVLSAVNGKPYELPNFTNYRVTPEVLEQYLGVYSSTEIPLKITVTKKDTTLIAQATGQPSFPLEPTEKDKFKFDQAGVVMEFKPSEKTMILKQAGGEYTFSRE